MAINYPFVVDIIITFIIGLLIVVAFISLDLIITKIKTKKHHTKPTTSVPTNIKS